MVKRVCFAAYLVAIGACTVGTPIAEEVPATEEQLSAEDQLRVSIEPFCADFCALLTQCGSEPQGDPCIDDCQEYMSVFVDHGDACVGYGQAVRTCFAPLDTCEELDDPPACAKDDDAYDLCKEADSSGPPLGAVTCEVSGGAGGPVNNGGPFSPTMCELYGDYCSDGSTYEVLCKSVDDALTCTCFKDGQAGATFAPAESCPPPLDEVNERCGYHILG